jgi:hypothetical protein
LDESLPKLIAALEQLPQIVTPKITQSQNNDPPEHLIDAQFWCYIAIYYYTALTNFWAQTNVPEASAFDEANEFHQLTRRVVDGSFQDFGNMERLLGQCDQQRLARATRHTRSFWRPETTAAHSSGGSPMCSYSAVNRG